MLQNGFEGDDFNTEGQMNFNSQVEQNAMTGGLLIGVAGAFLGALVGAVPWIVVVSFGWFIGWLAFLIGIVSLKGYALFRGPKNYMFANLTIWVSSLLVIIIMNFVAVIIQMGAEGIPLTLYNIKYIFEILLKDTSYYTDIGMSVVIGIVGLFGIGKKVRAYVHS